MTLAELRTWLRKIIGNPSTTDVPEADLTERLNEAYKEIAMRYKLYNARKLCTFVTTIDEPRYAIPADAYAVLRLRDNTNKTRLSKVGDNAYSRRTSDTSGYPIQYTRHRTWVTLMPPPAGEYTMEMYYTALPADLSGDGDIPVIPVAWHKGLGRLARSLHFDDTGDFPKATAAMASYNRWLQTMPTEIEEEVEHMDGGVEIPSLGESASDAVDWDYAL
jgi:hypothetical protein